MEATWDETSNISLGAGRQTLQLLSVTFAA